MSAGHWKNDATLHNSKSFIKCLKGIVYLKIILAKRACTDAYIKNTPKNIIWESLVTNFNIQASTKP